jgi:hypothetical protein
MSDTAYDDDFSDEELKALNEGMADDTLPPPDESEGAPAEPVVEPVVAPVDPAAAVEPAVENDGGMSEFMAKHAGKTPEELLKIAFQQSQRAGKAEVGQRQSQEQIDSFRVKAQEVLAARKQAIADKREAFHQRLQEDPDAATLELHESLLAREEAAAEGEEHLARIDSAIELASGAIPDFANRYQDIAAFGQELNFTTEEINAIDDGRHLVTLYLASLSGNLIKSGVMDAAGNFRSMPTPTAQTDPRLELPKNAMTSLSTPGNAATPTTDMGQELANLLQLSDADFDNLTEAELELLLRRGS